MNFDYAIKNQKNNKYYRGSVYGDEKDWTNNPKEIFAYSLKEAHKKIQLFPIMFKNCTVEQIL